MISSWSTKTKEELGKALNTDLKNGLSEDEALDRLILARNTNKKIRQSDIFWQSLLSYFNSIRFVSLAVFVGLSVWQSEIGLGIVTLCVIFLDALIWSRRLQAGFLLSSRENYHDGGVVVMRSGSQKVVSSRMLVKGDIVFLKAGDMARCTMRVINADNFSISASAYLVFSKPIFKNEEPIPSGLSRGELSNIVFEGSFVISGMATLVVLENRGHSYTNTIKNVEFLAKRLTNEVLEEVRPAFRKFFVILPFLFFVISYLFGLGLLNSFLVFIACLFLFSWRLYTTKFLKIVNQTLEEISKYSSILKNPSVLNKLSRVIFVILDKTGVFVDEELKLSKIYTMDSILNGSFDALQNKKVLEMAVLSSELFLKDSGNSSYGSPIDRAIIAGGLRAGITASLLENKGFNKLDYLPFSRDKWFSATLYDTPASLNRVYFGGEPMRILSKCQSVLQNDKVAKKTALWQEKILETLKEKAGEGFKIVAISYKDVFWKSLPKNDEIINDSVFVGFLCFSIKTKEGVVVLAEKARKLGVKLVLVSGDYPESVTTFATDAGIIKIGQVLTGEDLKGMTDREIYASLKRDTIYASVPSDVKLRMVQILKDYGEEVLFVGEKNEDINMILSADIGVASPLAKDIIVDASDIISKSGFAGVYGALYAGKQFGARARRILKKFPVDIIWQALLLFMLISAGFSINTIVIFILAIGLLGAVIVPKDTKGII